MKATFDLFLDFLEAFITEEPDWRELLRVGFSELINEVKETYQQVDPVELFRSTFLELWQSGELNLPTAIEVQPGSGEYPERLHGFWVDSTTSHIEFIVFSRNIYVAINDFLVREGKPLLPPEREFWKMMEEAGIAERPKTHHVPRLGKKFWGRHLRFEIRPEEMEVGLDLTGLNDPWRPGTAHPSVPGHPI